MRMYQRLALLHMKLDSDIISTMKHLLGGSIVTATILLIAYAYNSNYLSYYNCMSQTKTDAINQKSIDHVAAQCRTFILEKAMIK